MPASNRQITLNGRKVSFTSGQTILEVATANDVWIPTLCHLKGTIPTGACRVCVVEVDGARTLLAACSTPAAADMIIRTESSKVIQARKAILKLLLSSGNHNCAIATGGSADWTQLQIKAQHENHSDDMCPAWGDCRLQDLAYAYQVSGEPDTQAATAYPLEDSNPLIVRDFSRCILCGRCVQVCNQVQVNRAISFGYRGVKSKIVAAGDRPLKDIVQVFRFEGQSNEMFR